MPKSGSKPPELLSAATLSVWSNSLLIAVKLLAGFSIMSVAVLSEAIHSATDLMASLIARHSVKKSTTPADELHRFGHGKYESLSGAAEGVLILVAAGFIVLQSALKLREVSEIEFIEFGIIVMAFSAILNFFVSRYLLKIAKKYESLALEADALHLRTDVWTSIGVFVGLMAIYITGIHQLDSIIALIVAVFIVRAAIGLIRRSAFDLLDYSLTRDELQAISASIKQIAGELATYHDLRTRRSGRERFIDFHLILPKNLPIENAHNICDEIENSVKRKLSHANLTIHIEPCDMECEYCVKTESCKDRS